MESKSERRRILIRQVAAEAARMVRLRKEQWRLMVTCRELFLYPAKQIQAVFDAGIVDTEWIAYRLTLIEQLRPLVTRLQAIVENKASEALEKRLMRVI